MKNRKIAVVIIILFITSFFSNCTFTANSNAQATPDVYVGIDLAYGDVADAKALIDQVYSYTNLVVVGTTRITWYPDKANETFQYAYDKGLSIISLPPSLPDSGNWGVNKTEWYKYAQTAWGNKLLGFYYADEPGGKQLDFPIAYSGNTTGKPNSYEDAAAKFITATGGRIDQTVLSTYPYKAFTSDYALYWFDYKAGYDTVFAEFGWNYSRQVNVALCRGAAEAQNKDWGAIITWTYTQPPYIESGEQLYNDMVYAYDNGAKYIIVFSNDEQNHGILKQEHFDAIKRFWNYAKNNPRKAVQVSDRTAYVLPEAYGFGFRWPTDHIWGYWNADELAPNICLSVGTLLEQYGEKLDIIYDDDLQSGTNGYRELIYWDSYEQTPSPSPTSSPMSSAPLSQSPSSDTTPNNPVDATFPMPVIAIAVVSGALVSAFTSSVFSETQLLKPSKTGNALRLWLLFIGEGGLWRATVLFQHG